jgi:hypothetical protein
MEVVQGPNWGCSAKGKKFNYLRQQIKLKQLSLQTDYPHTGRLDFDFGQELECFPPVLLWSLPSIHSESKVKPAAALGYSPILTY